MKPFDHIKDPRALRLKLGINQLDFWARLGVTQSGGSRYETGREMPPAVRELYRLVYVQRVRLSTADGRDMEVGRILRKVNRALYNELSQRIEPMKTE
jgi:transcriptional regulator with XRE-family HTH domain